MWPCLSVRGAGVRPDSAITAARESARRKNKSFAQYTGVLGSGRPYRLGLEPHFFAPAGRMRHPQGVRPDSLLERYLNTSNLAATCPRRRLRQGLNFRRESRKTHQNRSDGVETVLDSCFDAFSLREPVATSLENAIYSAARACNDVGFAAETMKSWMRGTISDLNRDPLNTP